MQKFLDKTKESAEKARDKLTEVSHSARKKTADGIQWIQDNAPPKRWQGFALSSGLGYALGPGFALMTIAFAGVDSFLNIRDLQEGSNERSNEDAMEDLEFDIGSVCGSLLAIALRTGTGSYFGVIALAAAAFYLVGEQLAKQEREGMQDEEIDEELAGAEA